MLFYMLESISVFVLCVFDMLDFSSVILQFVFNTCYIKVFISGDVFPRSRHFTCVVEGFVSTTICVFIHGTPRNRTEEWAQGTSTLSISKSEPYMLDACLGKYRFMSY